MFGFIVSDTFFTLSTKQRLRDLFQNNRLHRLGQCDPFKATVDAAIFVAEKSKAKDDDELVFIQARYKTDKSTPETELINLIKGMPKFKKGEADFKWNNKAYPVYHSKQGCLRIHKTKIEPYRKALKHAFFEPNEAIVHLYDRFMEPVTHLVDKWWNKIETSKKFAKYKNEILEYHRSLKPGDVTLVGLIAEGGQGMRTANNGRFLGFLKGTEESEKIIDRQKSLLASWKSNLQIEPVLSKLLETNDNDFESVVEPLKEQFNTIRDLGLKRGEIYRVVDPDEVANPYIWDDTTRSKVISEGIEGIQTWVPFRKGDPEGNKWIDHEPLFINWSKENLL
jgi:hypothetical protein